jgi:nicotinamide-nucleotide amidase
MTEQVIPRLQKKYTLPVIYHKVIRTIGQGESFLAEKIADWESALPPHIKLAYLPSLGEVKLRLTCFGSSLAALEQEAEQQTDLLRQRIGQLIYAYGDTSIQEAIGALLREKKRTLSIAESCTGGYVSHLITSVPGSSDYFQGSIVPYSYDIKMSQLGVKEETLNQHGAVSEQTISEMAVLVRKKFNTNIGVATSGIAGPGGATAEKAVGTVWIAYADENGVTTKKLQLSKERHLNIELASKAVLNLIRLCLKESMAKQANA